MMPHFSAAFALITLAASPIGSAATAGGPTVPNEGQASPAAPVKDAPTAGVSDETWNSEKRRAALRLQLFLDKEGFGPGKIDGRWGGFSQKAAERWNAAGDGMKISILESGELDLAKTSEIPYGTELLTTYEITAKDQARASDRKKSEPGLVLTVLRAQRVVEVRRGGKLIRFSNWDALDLGKTVTVGTRVVVK